MSGKAVWEHVCCTTPWLNLRIRVLSIPWHSPGRRVLRGAATPLAQGVWAIAGVRLADSTGIGLSCTWGLLWWGCSEGGSSPTSTLQWSASGSRTWSATIGQLRKPRKRCDLHPPAPPTLFSPRLHKQHVLYCAYRCEVLLDGGVHSHQVRAVRPLDYHCARGTQ